MLRLQLKQRAKDCKLPFLQIQFVPILALSIARMDSCSAVPKSEFLVGPHAVTNESDRPCVPIVLKPMHW